MNEQRRSFAALGFGVTFCVAAVALLLQELHLVQLRWSIVAPIMVLVIGVVVVSSGVIMARKLDGHAAD
jgi:hypothetical protein